MLTEEFLTFWESIIPFNAFYLKKLDVRPETISKSWIRDNFYSLPFTTKKDLQDNQLDYPPYGNFHHLNSCNYSRFHQTSGSSGKPLFFLDSNAGWEWLLQNWLKIFEIAGIDKDDRLFFPFSFGPFLGFWTAFEASYKVGCLSFPGGGLSSEARLALIQNQKINVIFTTPSYALRLGEVSKSLGIDLKKLKLKKLILAGEPGANISATRLRIENHWGPIVVDHHGMTETGPVTIECPKTSGILHIIENAFIPEIIDPKTNKILEYGSTGELVLSSSGRVGCPLLRYKTGDIVNLNHQNCSCGFSGFSLFGGILSRADEMIFLKGNNIYPTALQNTLHAINGVKDFKITFDNSAMASSLIIEIETDSTVPDSLKKLVEQEIQAKFLFKPIVKILPEGTLPKQELKSKRFIKN